MGERKYTEPTNKQLASFLTVYKQFIPGAEHLQLNASMLEGMMDRQPHFREAALRHHREFQDQLLEHTEKMAKGELKCEHIRPNKKRCVNYNEPGSYYCGLHKPEEVEA